MEHTLLGLDGSPALRVGITGGMGAGKSHVCKWLRGQGFPVFDCDSQARRLMQENATLRAGLVRLLGSEIFDAAGRLNKPVMAAYLFADSAHASLVNGLVHPFVRDAFLQWASLQRAEVVFMECAILRQSHFDAFVDKVVRVTAPLEIRVSRVAKRDGLERTDICRRMRSQMEAEEEIARSDDFVIQNDGTQPLDNQLKSLLSALLSIRHSGRVSQTVSV